MNILHHVRYVLAALVLSGTAFTAANAQYVGGDLSLDLDDNGDIFVLAADVTLRGRVGGDVDGLAADMSIDADIGGDVSVAVADFRQEGRVGGDVNVGAANAVIAGEVLGSVNLGAADITVSGQIRQDLNASGASVVLEASGLVGGDAELNGRDLRVDGQVLGGLEAFGRDVRISGEVAGPVEIRARSVVIEESARLLGPVLVESLHEPTIEDGAVIPQGVTYEYREFTDREFGDYDGPNFKLPEWPLAGASAFSAFILGMLAVLIAPRSVGAIAAAFRRRPFISTLLGLIVLAVSPVLVLTLMVLLMITIVGIPLGLILLFIYPVVLFLAFAFGGMAVGDLVFNRKGGQAGLGLRAISFLVALAAIVALGMIPVIGWLIVSIVLCIGLGAWSVAIFSRHNDRVATTDDAV
ncbi:MULTISPECIES: polymer-forming cytoskeletal protein [Marinicauda]|uniref:polymer-forming cytoskeletal protein n=1 Tax=Marinicauda TaxID=1649466 RepID=UPI0022E8700F|nr:polymer-forming cytoskeletal protein [Marinicauda sp. Alg238-R41]